MTLASILGDAIIGLWKSQKAVWIRSSVTSNPGKDDKSKNPATFQGHCLPIVVSKNDDKRIILQKCSSEILH